MLVLGAWEDDVIYIDLEDGRRITIVVQRSRGMVGLGFDAPKSIKINRRVVAEAIEAGAKKGVERDHH